MGDMGLSWAYGNADAAQALRQQILDRLGLQQQQFQNDLALRASNRADQALAEQTAERKAHELEIEQRNRELAGNQQLQRALATDEQTPAGPIAADSSAVPLLKSVGAIENQPSLPSTQTTGTLTLPGGSQPMVGTLRSINAPSQYQKRATAKQAQASELADIKHQLADVQEQKANQGPKEPTPHYTFMPQYENGQPIGTLRGNTLTGELSSAGGQITKPPVNAPGAAQAATETRHKQEASATLDQLDQTIEQAKDLIGPGQGRVTNLEQLAGMADPRAQALGTKMLLAKMKVDAGIGGMRAAASPQLLSRWDNLLANKITPEGLHAAVQAMREIINAGGGTGRKKTAAELIQQYGQP